MDVPFDDLLGALASDAPAADAWATCCDALAEAAPSPAWATLRALDASADVDACGDWLAEQLRDASEFLAEAESSAPRGVVVWLDPQSLADGEGWCLEIGATGECDPSADDMAWTERCPWVGDFHLVAGIATAESTWLGHPDVRELVEYAVFLFYGGLVLRDAIASAGLSEAWLLAWGFPEGDQGLLARGQGGSMRALALLA